jgi:hypothetical protein
VAPTRDIHAENDPDRQEENVMRNTIAGILTVAGLAAAPTPAAPGVADIGAAEFTGVSVPAQAPCSLSGPTTATAPVVARPGITFGGGISSCTKTDATTTTSTATGKDFDLSALTTAGGPRIRLSTFTVTCTATPTQSNANWTFGGLSGLTNPPNPVPPGYVTPISSADGTVLANAVFNTQTLPGDGSVALTMLRIDFLPASGVAGDVVLGRTSCSPTP